MHLSWTRTDPNELKHVWIRLSMYSASVLVLQYWEEKYDLNLWHNNIHINPFNHIKMENHSLFCRITLGIDGYIDVLPAFEFNAIIIHYGDFLIFFWFAFIIINRQQRWQNSRKTNTTTQSVCSTHTHNIHPYFLFCFAFWLMFAVIITNNNKSRKIMPANASIFCFIVFVYHLVADVVVVVVQPQHSTTEFSFIPLWNWMLAYAFDALFFFASCIVNCVSSGIGWRCSMCFFFHQF